MRNKAKYTAIGYVVSKFVFPVAKRQAKASAKRKARGTVDGATSAARSHPARTSLALGAAAGAIGWLVTRGRSGSDVSSGDDVD